MSGAIGLVGSGEYLPQMLGFEKSLLERGLANRQQSVFVQIPTAAGKESEQRLKYWKELGAQQAQRLGIDQVFLDIRNHQDAMQFADADIIENAALIYLSGGDPRHLAQSLQGTSVATAIKNAFENGSSIVGCSAGAMALGSDVPHVRGLPHHRSDGLGVVPHIQTVPHYDRFVGWMPDWITGLLVSRPLDGHVIGIDEDTAMWSDDLRAWHVWGRGKVHNLTSQPATSHSHDEILHLDSPLL